MELWKISCIIDKHFVSYFTHKMHALDLVSLIILIRQCKSPYIVHLIYSTVENDRCFIIIKVCIHKLQLHMFILLCTNQSLNVIAYLHVQIWMHSLINFGCILVVFYGCIQTSAKWPTIKRVKNVPLILFELKNITLWF